MHIGAKPTQKIFHCNWNAASYNDFLYVILSSNIVNPFVLQATKKSSS